MMDIFVAHATIQFTRVTSAISTRVAQLMTARLNGLHVGIVEMPPSEYT